MTLFVLGVVCGSIATLIFATYYLRWLSRNMKL
jgi:hypothetical protein